MENVTEAPVVIGTEPVGTRMVSVSLRERWTKLAVRMAIGSAVTAWLFYLQFQNNAPAPYMLWGFAIFALSTFLGVRVFGIRERRVFDTTKVRYTHAQRLKRAARWFAPGVVMLGFIWGVQVASDQFSTYWWYAWPALMPLVVGVGLYMLRTEGVLAGSGRYAMAQLDAAKAQKRQELGSTLERLLEVGPVRYAIAAVCFYGAYYFAFEDTGKKAGLAAVCALIVGFVFARELGLWLLGLALVIGIGWGLFAGIAALPVSIAVIVGALIIASAVSKK